MLSLLDGLPMAQVIRTHKQVSTFKKEQANIRLLFFCFKMYLAGEAETDTSRRPDESDFWKSSSKEASLAGPVKKGPLIELHYKL